MDLHPDPEGRLLRQTARALVDDLLPPDRLRALATAADRDDAAAWDRMRELGWLGWAFPEALGGAGGRFADLAVLLEELGRAAWLGWFGVSIARAGLAIAAVAAAHGEDDEDATHRLAGLIDGSQVWALAGDDAADRVEVRRDGSEWLLAGGARLIPFGCGADRIAVAARLVDEGGHAGSAPDTLVVVEPGTAGLTLAPTPGLGLEPLAEARFDGVRLGPESVIGRPGAAAAALRRARAQATIGVAATMLGGADAVLEMTLAHARERTQRGRAIGSHESIQHRCADVAVAIAVGRGLVEHAAWLVDRGDDASAEAAMAKAFLGDAYRNATWTAALVLGGAGFMEEHPIGLQYRRARAAELELGDVEAQREAVAAALLDA